MIGSIFYFAIPSALVPSAMMLLASLLAFRLEGRPLNWVAFRDRMRLSRPSRKVWLWTLALLIFSFGLLLLISPVVEALERMRFFNRPGETTTFVNAMRAGFPEVDLSGRWGVLLWLVFSLTVFNIGGEELWWRGIILPRQELVFSRWTWLVHGLLWTLFHVPDTVGALVGYVPATLPIAFVAQRTRNTWPGIVVHLIVNMVFMLAVLRITTAGSNPGQLRVALLRG
jgi:membrane protease YdiL (CAAX protease family)